MSAPDTEVRAAMFAWLEDQVARHSDVLPARLLDEGFEWGKQRIPLRNRAGRGIWKPRFLDLPLSLLTSKKGPYDDHFQGEILQYRYQGTNPESSDNRAVRLALRHQTPLLYLHGVDKGWYFVTWPVFVVGDDPQGLRFEVQADPAGLSTAPGLHTFLDGAGISLEGPRRAYGTAQIRTRLHQRGFRHRVLEAYRTRCAMCKLAHRELLDAAHIIQDSEAYGEPVVSNGLALCKIHHAAFDARVIGIRPEERPTISVREDVLKEHDGPMLEHGLKALHGQRLLRPRRPEARPDRERLEARWEQFLSAG